MGHAACPLGFRDAGIAPAMMRGLTGIGGPVALAMAYFEALDGEAVTDFEKTATITLSCLIAATFLQALKRDKTYAVVFIAHVWPDHVIEYMCLDSFNCKG